MGGSKAWRARAITDLAVPRRPAIAPPPIQEPTAANSSASLMASCPTTAVRGKAETVEEIVGAGIISILASPCFWHLNPYKKLSCQNRCQWCRYHCTPQFAYNMFLN